jgi:hypothetical protein
MLISICGHDEYLSWIGYATEEKDTEGKSLGWRVTTSLSSVVRIAITDPDPDPLFPLTLSQIEISKFDVNENWVLKRTLVDAAVGGGRTAYVLYLEIEAPNTLLNSVSDIKNSKEDSQLRVTVRDEAFDVNYLFKFVPDELLTTTVPNTVYLECSKDAGEIKNLITDLEEADDGREEEGKERKHDVEVSALKDAIDQHKGCAVLINGTVYECYNKYDKGDWVLVSAAETQTPLTEPDPLTGATTSTSYPAALYTNWAQPVDGDTVLGSLGMTLQCPTVTDPSADPITMKDLYSSVKNTICYALDPDVENNHYRKYVGVGSMLDVNPLYTEDSDGISVLSGYTCSELYAAAPGLLWSERYPAQRLTYISQAKAKLSAPGSGGGSGAPASNGTKLCKQTLEWSDSYSRNFSYGNLIDTDGESSVTDTTAVNDYHLEKSTITYTDNSLTAANINSCINGAINNAPSIDLTMVGNSFTFAGLIEPIRISVGGGTSSIAPAVVPHTEYREDEVKVAYTDSRNVRNGSKTVRTVRTIFKEDDPQLGGGTASTPDTPAADSGDKSLTGLCVAQLLNSTRSNLGSSPKSLPFVGSAHAAVWYPDYSKGVNTTADEIKGKYWKRTTTQTTHWDGPPTEGETSGRTVDGTPTEYSYYPPNDSTATTRISLPVSGVALASSVDVDDSAPLLTIGLDTVNLSGGTLADYYEQGPDTLQINYDWSYNIASGGKSSDLSYKLQTYDEDDNLRKTVGKRRLNVSPYRKPGELVYEHVFGTKFRRHMEHTVDVKEGNTTIGSVPFQYTYVKDTETITREYKTPTNGEELSATYNYTREENSEDAEDGTVSGHETCSIARYNLGNELYSPIPTVNIEYTKETVIEGNKLLLKTTRVVWVGYEQPEEGTSTITGYYPVETWTAKWTYYHNSASSEEERKTETTDIGEVSITIPLAEKNTETLRDFQADAEHIVKNNGGKPDELHPTHNTRPITAADISAMTAKVRREYDRCLQTAKECYFESTIIPGTPDIPSVGKNQKLVRYETGLDIAHVSSSGSPSASASYTVTIS